MKTKTTKQANRFDVYTWVVRQVLQVLLAEWNGDLDSKTNKHLILLEWRLGQQNKQASDPYYSSDPSRMEIETTNKQAFDPYVLQVLLVEALVYAWLVQNLERDSL